MHRIAFVGVFLFSLPALGVAQNTGTKHALLIGVKRYNNVNFQNLYYTENDVVEFSKLLAKNGFQVTLLSDSQQAEAQPTRENFMKHLDRVLLKREREDTVIFGFAGHGLQFEGEKTSYFLPRDAEPGDSTTMVSLQTVYDKLEQCGAGVKLMFVDACRTPDKKVRGRSAFDDKTPSPPRGVAAFFSCSAGQSAYEDNELKHGIFFYHVLKGLEGAAKNNKNEVTIFRLMDYATQMVEASGHEQRPAIKGDLTNGVLVQLGSSGAPGVAGPTKSQATSGPTSGKAASAGTLLDEDFRASADGSLPKGWDGDNFRVVKTNGQSALEVSTVQSPETVGLPRFVATPNLSLDGDFKIEGTFLLEPSVIRVIGQKGSEHSVTVKLESKKSVESLAVVFEITGTVRIGADVHQAPASFKPGAVAHFQISRTGKQITVMVQGERVAGKKLQEAMAFDSLQIGLTEGGRNRLGNSLGSCRLLRLRVATLDSAKPD